jgi:ATP-dependent exoDNAse (exonuclease V) beta subunit
MRKLAEGGAGSPETLARLDGVFFSTIHGFCLYLAQRHGSPLGVHRDPVLIETRDAEEEAWQEFLEQDSMTFSVLAPAQVDRFLRFSPLEAVFELALKLDAATARRLAREGPAEEGPVPARAALEAFLALPAPRHRGRAPNFQLNQENLRAWDADFSAGRGRLPLPEPEGEGKEAVAAFRAYLAPIKAWMAVAGGALAAELALRYRAWRSGRGLQTFGDQIETALGVLQDQTLLEQLRAEGWRVILDEAQDTDPQQFAVLVEITRPAQAQVGTWPDGGGPPPRPGHFCLVGDPQQSIYSERADIANFNRHVDAFGRGDGGDRLAFSVTFRAPQAVVALLNASLPDAFGAGRRYNQGVPPSPGAPAPLLQVAYEPLVAGPRNAAGRVARLPYEAPATEKPAGGRDRRLAAETAALAAWLKARGPAGVGAADWGDICILAPRVKWLPIIRDELEKAGLKTALQMRHNRAGDNPVYAWLSGLLAVICDPSDRFEWVGVLREVFAVSDALIAQTLPGKAELAWEVPETYPAPIAEALQVLRPFLSRVDDEGDRLLAFATDLVAACGLGARAFRLDPDGGLEDELERLLARAADLGAEGAGPREWRKDLLRSLDTFRAAGRPARDALNLMTCHSAKGLEWPVVIPVGLGRTIEDRKPFGLRLINDINGRARLVFDQDGVGAEARDSIERARIRELVRLLYVTLTRAETSLVLPWAGPVKGSPNFAGLWGHDLSTLPAVAEVFPAEAPQPVADRKAVVAALRVATVNGGTPAPALPRRLLPHQLTPQPDWARAALHESAQDLPPPVRDTVDPLDYGVWWHETLEFVPWTGDDAMVAAHGEACLARAATGGFAARARADWARLLASEPWRALRDPRWTRLAEVGVLAPLREGEWIDGVIDLVLHDPARGDLWIVDWKTNRRGSGEDDAALLDRLAVVYRAQLSAYGTCTAKLFTTAPPRLLLYSTEAGAWREILPAT